MKRIKTVYSIFFLLFTASMFFNFSSNPPNGRTGAPGESTCSSCHSQNAGFDGNIAITGFPSTIQPNTTYSITLTVNATTGNPANAGFQLVALDGSNNNTGSFTPMGSTATQSSGGRTYIEHRPAQAMSGNSVSYNFDWESPSSAAGDEVTLYSAALMGNGSGSNNDKTLTTSLTSTLNSSNPPTVNITNFTDVSCNGGNDGDATAQATGGTPPLVYSWSTGGSGTFVSGLSAGTISVTVTDDNGMTATDQVNISEPALLTISIINQTNIDCNNLTGTATAEGDGGVGGYSYSWGNGETGSTATNLPLGITAVTVTDGNGCISTTLVDILEDTNPPIAEAGTATITCAPDINLNGTGSSVGNNISFLWTAPNGSITSGSTGLVATATGSGPFILEVVDNNNGCSSSDQATITQDDIPPVADAGLDKELNCNIIQTLIGGTNSSSGMGFTYQWTTTTGNIVSGGNSPQALVDMEGIYTLEVTNSQNSCTASDNVEVISIENPVATVLNISGVTCFGDNDGTATANVTMGEPPFTYAWSSGESTMIAINLQAGSNTLTVTDNNSCTSEVNFVVSTPDEISVNASSTDVTGNGINDGTAIANPTGGTPGYSYTWSNGENTQSIINLAPGDYSVTVTDSNGCSKIATVSVSNFNCTLLATFSSTSVSCFGGSDGSAAVIPANGVSPFFYQWSNGSTSASINNLTAGTYSCTISDSGNCFIFGEVVVTESAELMANPSITNVSCFGGNDGSISFSPTGGTPPYMYSWIGGMDSFAVNLTAGDYFPTITDANGCSATPTISISQPAEIIVSLLMTDESGNMTNDGTGTAMVSGGTPPYSYEWSNGATSEIISNLSPGDYFLTVTDSNGCRKTEGGTVQSFICSGIAVNVDDSNNYICPGSSNGSLSILGFSGGKAPYDFTWSTGDTTEIIQNLSEGIYTLMGSDIDGCTFSQSYQVVAEDTIPPVIICPGNISSINCSEVVYPLPTVSDNCDNDILPELQVGFASGTTFPEGLTMLTFSSTDDSGNISNCSFSIEVTNTLNVEADIETFNCDGTATLMVNFSGGTPPYVSTWAQGTPFIVTDSFTLQVTDSNNCSVNFDTIFSVPEPIVLVIDSTRKEQQLMGDGAAFSTVSGGAMPFAFEWSNESGDIVGTDQNLDNVPSGIYILTLIDANECTAIDSVFIDRETVSTNDINLNQLVGIYPNPSNGNFQLNFDLPFAESFKVQIFNLDGKLIEQTPSQVLQKSEMRFDLKTWGSKLYFVKILIGNKVLVKRLMIE